MKLKIGQSIIIGESWLDKKVKNPKTGNMVKVRSLDPKDQEKYRPKKEHKDKAAHPAKKNLSKGLESYFLKNSVSPLYKQIEFEQGGKWGEKVKNALPKEFKEYEKLKKAAWDSIHKHSALKDKNIQRPDWKKGGEMPKNSEEIIDLLHKASEAKKNLDKLAKEKLGIKDHKNDGPDPDYMT